MDIILSILDCVITGLFCALWILMFARFGLFPVALIQIKPFEEDVNDN